MEYDIFHHMQHERLTTIIKKLLRLKKKEVTFIYIKRKEPGVNWGLLSKADAITI